MLRRRRTEQGGQQDDMVCITAAGSPGTRPFTYRQWCFFTALQDNGIACSNGWGYLVSKKDQWKVPRDDRGDHPVRLLKCHVDETRRVEAADTLRLVSCFGIVLKGARASMVVKVR